MTRRARPLQPIGDVLGRQIFCDGSGTLSQSPAAIGVVLLEHGLPFVEVSEHIGEGTNNVAELRALRRALFLADQVGWRDQPFTVYSDSEYAIGMTLRPEWHARSNAALVAALRAQWLGQNPDGSPQLLFPRAAIRYVHGHSGVFGNELADWLAGRARLAHLQAQGLKIDARMRPRPEMLPAPEEPPRDPARCEPHPERRSHSADAARDRAREERGIH